MKNKTRDNRPNTLKADKPSSPKASALLPVILPKEFAPIPGMNQVTLAAAVNVGAKHPDIVKAAVEFREAYGRAGEKFFGIASALRAAKLVKKEATMLMHALGFSASRTSEMIKLSSVSDEIWGKYSAQSVGFRAALQLEDEANGDAETSTGGKKKERAAPAKIHPLSKHALEAINGLTSDHCPMVDGKRTEYSGTIELGNGAFLHVTIFSDKE